MSNDPSSHPWHLLQVSDVLDREFALALAESVPVIAWEPQRTLNPWEAGSHEATHKGLLTIQPFPLLRGYARFPASLLTRTGPTLAARLRHLTPDSRSSPLLCTTPFFASVAEQWDGPVIYWLTDLIAEYSGVRGIDVPALDRRMCRAATLVCPNSERLRDYLITKAFCDPGKIVVVPNATRASNVLPRLPNGPARFPQQISQVRRPVAGIIGNLAGNMDWLLLEDTIAAVLDLTWIFVGPTSMAIPDRRHRKARERVIAHERTHFIGPQPYGELANFARAFDVAVLPYLRCEPTYSGSSTRFYEHLAACRPMIATSGLEELTRKVPLLRLVNTSADFTAVLRSLIITGFDDGLTAARWTASKHATWQARARTVQDALNERWQSPHSVRSSDQRLSA